ncbi:hypothetical protein EMPG_17205 [Blastomyces silverae]|uniref:Uncharacterized protein n=1 Tax=Blastomyces silverae TaxID=2060906 RepID=A0A0H1B7G9_9EURO|nr:hypothetical protein EMPG_17205 [Blastomyces silverae]
MSSCWHLRLLMLYYIFTLGVTLIVISNPQTSSSSPWSLLLSSSPISGLRRAILYGPFAVLICTLLLKFIVLDHIQGEWTSGQLV